MHYLDIMSDKLYNICASIIVDRRSVRIMTICALLYTYCYIRIAIYALLYTYCYIRIATYASVTIRLGCETDGLLIWALICKYQNSVSTSSLSPCERLQEFDNRSCSHYSHIFITVKYIFDYRGLSKNRIELQILGPNEKNCVKNRW